jgi:hypothetical protein
MRQAGVGLPSSFGQTFDASSRRYPGILANRMDARPRAASIYCPYKLTAERAATFFPGLSWGQNGANALDELVHPVRLQAACLV